MTFKEYVTTPSPIVGNAWVAMSEDERITLIKEIIVESNNFDIQDIEIIGADSKGFITLTLNKALGASERGGFLLDLEAMLKEAIDVGVVIWLEPLNDKSALRKLRGIKVKNERSD